ncbi:MAG: hypothetical protein OEU54_00655 [Gemmatimonadota bacterium]|nr:hypothetical protein [Gemmatimonadota bacterium]
MHSRCLYCGHALGGTTGIHPASRSVRIAFDPERERVWTICSRCHGWNMWPSEVPSGAIEALERVAFDRARMLFQTDHVALLQAGDRELIRVGRPPRLEAAWWRYGSTLRRRRDRFASPATRVATATYSAVSSVGMIVGLSSVTGDFSRAANRTVEVLRWRRFGGTAWEGRAPCPSCGSVLIRLFFMKCGDLSLFTDGDGQTGVGMPCVRCDPWATDQAHRFAPQLVEPLLRRVLAWHNVNGATKDELDRAVALIEAAGPADGFMERLAARGLPLHAMTRVERLALEMAVNDRAERWRLAARAASIEAEWRRADELATIIEEEL